jgi:probable rRNA maturation factor
MPIAIDLTVEAGDWPSEESMQSLVADVIAAAAGRLGVAGANTELSILLTDNAAMRHLNAQWRGKDKPTNVLSFPAADLRPGDLPGPVLGDIVIARETVEEEAALECKPVDDHLRHLLVHGFLHLFGYDHEKDTDADEMEAAETAILADIGVSDPYSVND